mmetsp:Transcript_87925/g.247006  ORF Transcript_87925/g.247006 Transcript_87925/m.247006 type:complete len:263 (-) Transcript_87925:680-1468(-)
MYGWVMYDKTLRSVIVYRRIFAWKMCRFCKIFSARALPVVLCSARNTCPKAPCPSCSTIVKSSGPASSMPRLPVRRRAKAFREPIAGEMAGNELERHTLPPPAGDSSLKELPVRLSVTRNDWFKRSRQAPTRKDRFREGSDFAAIGETLFSKDSAKRAPIGLIVQRLVAGAVGASMASVQHKFLVLCRSLCTTSARELRSSTLPVWNGVRDVYKSTGCASVSPLSSQHDSLAAYCWNKSAVSMSGASSAGDCPWSFRARSCA